MLFFLVCSFITVHSAMQDHLSRHLLGRNTRNKVELYVMSDPGFTKMFKDKFPSNWKAQLTTYTKDWIDQASQKYEDQNWGNAGTIQLAMITLEIVEDFTGIYSSLRPRWAPGHYQNTCASSHWSRSDCKIDGPNYLAKFQTFVEENNRYGDDHLMLSRIDFISAQGWGTIGDVCKSRAAAIVDSPHFVRRVNTIAHEIGHNFGMQHDSPLIGIMGNDPPASQLPKETSGPWAGTGRMVTDPFSGKKDVDLREVKWSTKSYEYLTKFFVKKGYSCLTDGVRSFKTIHNPSGGYSGSSGGGSSRPSYGGGSSGGGSGGSSGSCLQIQSASYGYNGKWTASGSINGKKKYKNPNSQGLKWLYYTGRYWTVNNDYSSAVNSDYYCYSTTIVGCRGKWKVYGKKRTNSRFTSCGSFTADEALECLKGKEYDDDVCLYDDTDGYRGFTMGDMCFNDHPVYEYVADDISYHLYADMYYEYFGNNSAATVYEWVISLNEVASQDIVAKCEQWDLLQCSAGNWQVMSAANDSVAMIIDETMNVQNGQCEGSSRLTSNASSSTVAVWVCIGLAFALVLSIFAVCIWHRSKAKQLKKDAVSIGDESEEDEIEEVEVEVDTKLTETR